MSKTLHIKTRMAQRGISEDLLKLVLRYGEEDSDGRVILPARALARAESEVRTVLKTLERARLKGGIVVVKSPTALITTYALHRKRRRGGVR